MTIDLGAIGPHLLGEMVDLRGEYPPAEPGREYLRKAEVFLTRHGIDHLRQHHPERLEWLRQSVELLRLAIGQPGIASRHLDFKADMGHWAITLAAPLPARPTAYVSVVLSLANLDGPESDSHQLITAYRAKRRDFYTAEGKVKGRWIELRQQKIGP
jgi:hypothetical protein